MREPAEGRDRTLRETGNFSDTLIADVVVGKNIWGIPEGGEIGDCGIDDVVSEGLRIAKRQQTALELMLNCWEWGK